MIMMVVGWRERREGAKHVHGPLFRTQLRMRYLVESWREKNQLLLCLAFCEGALGLGKLC